MYMLIARLIPDIIIEYFSKILSSSIPINSLHVQPHAKVEILLSLLYWFGEVLTPKQMKEDGIYKETIQAVINSNAYKHKHYCVPRTYFELVARYSVVIENSPAFLEHVLNAMIGDGGLRHGNLKVRARIPYLLLKLSKAMKGEMAPYVEPVLHGISDFLRITADADTPSNIISVDNQMFLYELAGQLIVVVPEDNIFSYLSILVTPLLSQIEIILNNVVASGVEDDLSSLWVSRAVSALGYTSKSFDARVSFLFY